VLILTRKPRESVVIQLPDGRRVTVVLMDVHRTGQRVRLGFDAPADVKIHRDELLFQPAPPKSGEKCPS